MKYGSLFLFVVLLFNGCGTIPMSKLPVYSLSDELSLDKVATVLSTITRAADKDSYPSGVRILNIDDMDVWDRHLARNLSSLGILDRRLPRGWEISEEFHLSPGHHRLRLDGGAGIYRSGLIKFDINMKAGRVYVFSSDVYYKTRKGWRGWGSRSTVPDKIKIKWQDYTLEEFMELKVEKYPNTVLGDHWLRYKK